MNDPRYVVGRLSFDLTLLSRTDELLLMGTDVLIQLNLDQEERRNQLSVNSPIYRAVCLNYALVADLIAMRNRQDYELQTEVDYLHEWTRENSGIISQARVSVQEVLALAETISTDSSLPPLSGEEVLQTTRNIVASVPIHTLRNLPNLQQVLAPWEPPFQVRPADEEWTHRPYTPVTPEMPTATQEVPINLTEYRRPENAPPNYQDSLNHQILEGPDGHHHHPNLVEAEEELARPPVYEPIQMDIDHLHIYPDGSITMKGMKLKIPADFPPELVQGSLITAISSLFNGNRSPAPDPNESQPGPSRRRRSSSSSSDLSC